MPLLHEKPSERLTFVERQGFYGAFMLLGIASKSKRIKSELDLYDLIERGLSNRSIRSLLKKSGFSAKELSDSLPISARRLQRLSVEKNSSKLTAAESLSIWQFAVVFAQANSVMGSRELAKEWLYCHPKGTRYRRPIDLLALSPGVDFVLTLLARMAHGVFV